MCLQIELNTKSILFATEKKTWTFNNKRMFLTINLSRALQILKITIERSFTYIFMFTLERKWIILKLYDVLIKSCNFILNSNRKNRHLSISISTKHEKIVSAKRSWTNIGVFANGSLAIATFSIKLVQTCIVCLKLDGPLKVKCTLVNDSTSLD